MRGSLPEDVERSVTNLKLPITFINALKCLLMPNIYIYDYNAAQHS